MAPFHAYLFVAILGSKRIWSSQSTEIFCLDISPYCSEEDCWIRPGYAREFCRKTCGNCQDNLCYDSEYYPCAGMDMKGCGKYLKDYCPVLCGICEPLEYEPTAEDDSLSFFPRNSTFLGLFQPSRWIGQTFKPSQATETTTYSTIAPTTVTESKYDKLSTADTPTVALSISSTAATSTTPLVTTATFTTPTIATTSITSTSTTSTTSSASSLANSTPNSTPAELLTSTTPSATSTVNLNLKTSLSRSTISTATVLTPLLPLTTPKEIETSTTTSKATENKTIATTATTIQTTQAPSTATRTSITISPSTAAAREISTTERSPVDITTSARRLRFHPNEWMSYIRHLSHSARSLKKPPSLGSASTRTILLPKQRPNSKTGGVGGANNFIPPLAPSSRTNPTLTATGGPFARLNQRRHVFHHPQELSQSQLSGETSNHPSRGAFIGRSELTIPQPSPQTASIADIVTLLGCRDRDERTCAQITEVSCRARPGYYLKLCPVKCKNCNGLLCYDSNKVDCAKVVESGGCQLENAAEYCPQSCDECPKPSYLSDSGSRCKDEFPTCKNLAASGVCHHVYNVELLRLFCAKSCGFCKESPFYFMDTSQYYARVLH